MGKRIYGGSMSPYGMKKAKREPMSYRSSKYRKNYGSKNTKGRVLYSRNGRSSANGLYNSKYSSRQAYRRHLYDSTNFANHERSILSAGPTTVTTPLNASQKYVQTFVPIVASFWTTGGGYTGSKTFTSGDLVIRGGRVQYTLYNSSDVPLRVEFTNVHLKKPGADLPFTTGSFNQLWDPTQISEYQTYFKMNFRKVMLISPGERMQVSYKRRIQKINQDTWNAQEGMPVDFVAVHAPTSTADTLEVTRGFSLSFVGDAIAEV